MVEDVDLTFLFASDAELRDELTWVCDILASAYDDVSDEVIASAYDDVSDEVIAATPGAAASFEDTPPSSSEVSLRRKRVNCEARQKEEIERLRDQVETLATQLHQASTKRKANPCSFWKRTATTACLEKVHAIRENEQLKDDVTQQATFIERLTRVLRKKPRLSARIYLHLGPFRAHFVM
ncbi:Aste57867_16240 [Aphanomyces stellatus]|uniref:Aste57867_16240 protein n=1 Tax=Aphanomyces stellatus TaxID=120398 RepID=A0A485L569_9STRA|nr:hypothetical protein As57867_016183 [Aphanomyces stellatus]VFT93018.1 Aste57867_16240 [Aphanomyces stellatus]